MTTLYRHGSYVQEHAEPQVYLKMTRRVVQAPVQITVCDGDGCTSEIVHGETNGAAPDAALKDWLEVSGMNDRSWSPRFRYWHFCSLACLIAWVSGHAAAGTLPSAIPATDTSAINAPERAERIARAEQASREQAEAEVENMRRTARLQAEVADGNTRRERQAKERFRAALERGASE